MWDKYHMQICSAVFSVTLCGAIGFIMWLCDASPLLIAAEFVFGSVGVYNDLED